MKLRRSIHKALSILWQRLTQQGLRVTAIWAADHIARAITGAPIRRTSQVTPQLHVAGQYRQRAWPTLAARGVTAVVNLRVEFDDEQAGIAPERYLYLPTEDDHAPTLEQLEEGCTFISEEIANGGGVYVHCKSGIGRAAVMAAAYLVSTGLTVEQAWALVRQARPFIRPKPRQFERLERFAAQR
jgi:protein tyrosine phosphatase (PTP) superfamily phosphohydrolase (DUF442 family)